MLRTIDLRGYISHLLLVFVLFMSNKTFEFYYAGILSILTFYLLIKDVSFNIAILFFILFFGGVFIVRSLLFFGTYDLKEFLKFAIAVTIYSLIKVDVNKVKKILLFYVYADFLIGLFQFFHISIWGTELINSFYGATIFYDLLGADSVRAYGLSSSSGNRAALLFLLFILLNNFDFKSKGLKLFTLFLIVISIVLAQSKTVILVFILFVLFKSFVISKRLLLAISSLFLFFLFHFNLIDYLVYFSEYTDLLFNGFKISSVEGRFVNWQYYFTGVRSNILTFLFGPGRDYFSLKGSLAPAFDSDALYLLVNFGIVGIVFVFSMFILFYKKVIENYLLLEVLFFGMLCGLTINFFFDIKILFLLMVVFSSNNRFRFFIK